MNKKVLLVTGEMSGELHAVQIVKAMQRKAKQCGEPSPEFYGTGGDKLAVLGMRILYSIADMAVFGIGEVLSRYGFFKQIQRDLIASLATEQPDLAILIDYGGFNLRLLPKLKAHNIRVVYYIPPQIWLSRQRRAKIIKKYVDELIVILPFEEEFYAKKGIRARYFGHPLADTVRTTLTKAECAAKYGLDPQKPWIALLLGSRSREIAKHGPLMVEVMAIVREKIPEVQFLNCIATAEADILPKSADCVVIPPNLYSADLYNAAGHSDCALVCSGTSALEVALLQTPMLIYYRPERLTTLIAWYCFGIRVIGLPNIILQEVVIPELIEHLLPKDGSKASLAQHMADQALQILSNPAARQTFSQSMQPLIAALNQKNTGKINRSGANTRENAMSEGTAESSYQRTADFIYSTFLTDL